MFSISYSAPYFSLGLFQFFSCSVQNLLIALQKSILYLRNFCFIKYPLGWKSFLWKFTIRWFHHLICSWHEVSHFSCSLYLVTVSRWISPLLLWSYESYILWLLTYVVSTSSCWFCGPPALAQYHLRLTLILKKQHEVPSFCCTLLISFEASKLDQCFLFFVVSAWKCKRFGRKSSKKLDIVCHGSPRFVWLLFLFFLSIFMIWSCRQSTLVCSL